MHDGAVVAVPAVVVVAAGSDRRQALRALVRVINAVKRRGCVVRKANTFGCNGVAVIVPYRQ